MCRLTPEREPPQQTPTHGRTEGRTRTSERERTDDTDEEKEDEFVTNPTTITPTGARDATKDVTEGGSRRHSH